VNSRDQGNNPYLSVVVTSRNDNHGGTLTRRMQTFINALVAQCKRHNVSAELVIVEWNPPADRPRLIDELKWPAELGPCCVRIVEVPREIHQRYRFGESLPLYQFIAKNVGIRRARGEFILATNIDVIINHELMEFIGQKRLEKGRMYRIDRHDVETSIPMDAPIDEILEYCRSHLLRINAREGTFPVKPDGPRVLEEVDIAAIDSGLTLGAGWFEVVRQPPPGDPAFRFMGETAGITIAPENIDSKGPTPYLVLDIQSGPRLGNRPFVLTAESNDRRLASAVVTCRQKVSIPLPRGQGTGLAIELHCDGWREELPEDPRPLCAYVFGTELAARPAIYEPPADVFPIAEGLVAGVGWYAQEASHGGFVRWMNNEAEIWITPQARTERRFIVFALESGPSMAHRPFLLTVVDEEQREILSTFVIGRQRISVPIEPSADRLRHITLRVRSPDIPVPGDTRILNALLTRMEWSQETATPAAADQDVFPNSLGIAAANGWYAPEKTEGGYLRWMDNDAEIWFVCGSPARLCHLVLELSPGPSLGNRPFKLWATDEHGKEVFCTYVLQKSDVSIPVDMIPGTLRHLTLHLESPNLPVPGDKRILNAALTRIELASEAREGVEERDVFPSGLGLAAGSGWHPPEHTPQGYVRWMTNNAEIWFTERAGAGKWNLELDIEAGAGLDYRAFRLRATNQQGEEIFSRTIIGRQLTAIPIEAAAHTLGHITLCVQSENHQSGDGRLLNVLVRRVALKRQPPAQNREQFYDICSGEIDLGVGWYGVERTLGGPVRWITNHAEIFVDAAAGGREIKLDLELGPSAGRPPRKVIFRDENGGVVQQTSLAGRRTITCPLPAARRGLAILRVEVDSESKDLDGRMLNVLARHVELTKPDKSQKPVMVAAPAIPEVMTPAAVARQRRRTVVPPSTVEPMAPPAHAGIVSPVFLHNNACGDFTLMHRDHWFEVRGHAEWDAFSIHLDSLLCFCAHHSGAVETMLVEPKRLYHIEHSVGSGWTPEGMDKLLRRIRSLGIPDVDWREVGRIGVLLRRYNSPVSFSPSDWGLERESLVETTLPGTER
jgi:hypothetical protein